MVEKNYDDPRCPECGGALTTPVEEAEGYDDYWCGSCGSWVTAEELDGGDE